MKRFIGISAALLMCAGCFTAALPEALAPAKSSPLVAARTAPPPVTPEQVTPQNAQQILRLLDEEMTREQQDSVLAPR